MEITDAVQSLKFRRGDTPGAIAGAVGGKGDRNDSLLTAGEIFDLKLTADRRSDIPPIEDRTTTALAMTATQRSVTVIPA